MKAIRQIFGGLILCMLIMANESRAATGYGDSPVFAINLLGTTVGLSLNGSVLDSITGLGITGASLQLGTNSTVSDAQGAFNFASVVTGDYTLTASMAGYVDASLDVTITAGSSTFKIITLAPASAAGSLPSVTSIHSKYSDSSYYLDGAAFSVQFTANVDWAGHPPGTVQFIAPRKTYTVAATGASVSQTLAMGSDFGAGGQLRVVPVSSDGAQSAGKLAGFTVMPPLIPPPLALAWGASDNGNTFDYNCTLDVSFFNDGATVGDIPSNIPLFGGQELKLSFLPEADFQIGSDGSAQVTVHGLNFGSTKDLLGKSPEPKDFMPFLNNLVNGGFDTSLLPSSSFAGIEINFYPLLGGGWQYSSSAAQWGYVDALVGVGGEFSIQQTWPFLAGPVPMYAKAKFDLSAEATADVKNMSPLNLNGDLNVDPTLRGSLGVGVSEVLSAEGWIQGGVNMDIQWPQPPGTDTFSFSAEAGATVYALLWHWDYQGFYWSWPSTVNPNLALPMMRLTANGVPQPLGRGYLNYPKIGDFAPATGPKPLLFGVPGGGVNPEILLSPTIPYSDPDCCSSGTNLYLVFLEDNTNRASMNRTVAMFSKYDGTLWSTPTSISDDGTADFHPRIQDFPDGTAVAAWENESTLLPDTTTYEGMKSNLEVSVAWYNPVSGWQPALRMSTNNFIDYGPKLAGCVGNNVLMTWIANPLNDASGSSAAPNQIWYAKWNGVVWSAPQLAATVTNALLKYDLAYDGTNGTLVLSLDTVDNSTNNNSHELFSLAYQNGSWGSLTQMTSDQVPDDNPQLAFDPQNNLVLTWLKNGALTSALNLNVGNSQIVRTNDYSSNLSDFRLAGSSDGKLVLIWPEPSEYDSDYRAMIYDPISKIWGGARQLTHDPQTEYETTAAFYGTNEVVVVYNRAMISSTNTIDTTPADLAALYHTLGEDLALDGSQFNAMPANPAPGSVTTLSVNVLNLGDRAESNVVVAFYQGSVESDNQLGRVTVTNTIPPQGTNTVTFNWTAATTNCNVFGVVDPDQAVPDINRSNNVAQLNLVQPNTEIQSMTWSRVASNLLAITIRVINDGDISNGATTVSVTGDAVTNLFSQTIWVLAAGQSQDVTFIWNVAGLADNLNIYATLTGMGITNNFSTVNTTSALAINQVPPPWIAGYQYLTDGGFQLQMFGASQHAYTLLASTDLKTWTAVLNFTCTNSPMYIVDSGAKYNGWRFYRVAEGTLPIP